MIIVFPEKLIFEPFFLDEGLDNERGTLSSIPFTSLSQSMMDVLEQSYRRSLSKYYGQKPGRNCPLSDYGDYRSQVTIN